MDESPRYLTLRDYLRVLREHRLLIGIITALATGLALATSLAEEPTYTAKASLSFQDQSQDLGLIGVTVASNPTPEKLAEANARTIMRADVVRRVKESLDTTMSTEDLRRALSAEVEPKSNLVVLEARAREGSFAARLVNEFARQGASATNADVRERFSRAAENLRERVRRVGGDPRDSATRLALGDQISRLQSLSVLARPASVEELARVPSAPTSPRPLLRALLGLIGGLIVGGLAAFLRDSLDRRLRDSTEIKDHLNLPLLSLIRADALGRTVHSSNGHGPLGEPDFEAFRILRTNLSFLSPGSDLRSIVVTSALPEEGKTTVSAGLAFAAAAAGKRTLLVECDLRRPTLAGRLRLDTAPGLTDFLHGDASPAQILRSVAVEDVPADGGVDGAARQHRNVAPGYRLTCITAGSRTAHPAELLGSEAFRTFLDEVTQAYELVVIDTSPILPVVDTLELLPLVDGVVLCVRAQQTTRDQAMAAKAALEHLPSRPTGIVVTGTQPRFEGGYTYYSYGYTGSSAGKAVRS